MVGLLDLASSAEWFGCGAARDVGEPAGLRKWRTGGCAKLSAGEGYITRRTVRDIEARTIDRVRND